MDSSKASLTISDPYEENEKRKYSLRIDYAAKVSRVMTCIVKDIPVHNAVKPLCWNIAVYLKYQWIFEILSSLFTKVS